MLFKITSITPQGAWRDFLLYHDDLERIYKVLRRISEQGNNLLAVSLIDPKGDLPLPVDKLDDPLFANPIELLRRQWEELLTPPIDVYSPRGQFRHTLRVERTMSVRRALSLTQALEEKAYQSLKEGPAKARLLALYRQKIDQYSRLLVHLETASSSYSGKEIEDRQGYSLQR